MMEAVNVNFYRIKHKSVKSLARLCKGDEERLTILTHIASKDIFPFSSDLCPQDQDHRSQFA